MNMPKLLGVLMPILVLSACAQAQGTKTATDGTDAGASQLANPAATYCIETGGTYEITKAADGSEAGICTLKDGTKMDAWDYFRTQNN